MDRAAAELFLDHYRLSPQSPAMAGLEQVAGAFSRLPWENLTKYLLRAQDSRESCTLRMPLRVFEEHISLGAGGTCFSLTMALESVLKRLGYSCRPVMADMSHGPDIHCALLVRLSKGTALMDPGYLLPVPVMLHSQRAVQTTVAGQTFRYTPDGGNGWHLHTIRDGDVRWRYRLKGDPITTDAFLHHWRRSFRSTGMNSLHLSRLTDSGRLYAHNANLRVIERQTGRNLKLGSDYAREIEARFGLDRRLAGRAWRELRRARERRCE